MLNEALELFERAADRAFQAHPVPHPNYWVSAWYLLTVSEDMQRIIFTTDMNVALGTLVMDKLKYALRSCLALAKRKATDRTQMPLPDKVVPQLYTRAREMTQAGSEYAVVSQICGSIYEEAATIEPLADGFQVTIDDARIDARYGAFELMRQESDPEWAPPWFLLFWRWVRHEDLRPEAVAAIASSIAVKGRRVHYVFDPGLCQMLTNELYQRTVIIPQGWEFPWGGRHETILLTNALSVRLLYHACAVHFGSVQYGLAGGAEHDLVLCQSEDQWVEEILFNSSLDTDKIRAFVRFLTYGAGTNSPDQALQPFVPLGRRVLGVPTFGFLSSNVDRNLLTLQPRLEPQSFNRQSKLFEQEMTADLQAAFTTRWTHVVASRTFALGNTREELDLLVCEPETKTVFLMELRWILSPADPREVHQKKVACQEKVPQARRKRDALRENLPQLLAAAFGLQTQVGQEWQVGAAVVVQGFGGAPTVDPTVPIMPEWVVKEGVQHARTLRQLVAWVASSSWLPVEGRDFHSYPEGQTLLGMHVRFAGIFPKHTAREYLEDATAKLRKVQ